MKKSERYFITFMFFIGAILLFDLIDYFFHITIATVEVPERYFRNKALYGILFSFITYLFVKNKKLITRVLTVTFITSILIQTRYYLEGYPVGFVLEFFVIHTIIMLVVFWLGFKYILDPFLKPVSR